MHLLTLCQTSREKKLPAFYVLDSIVKNVGTPFTLFFGRQLYSTFMAAYALVDQPVRRKMDEMLKTWKEPVPGSMDTRPVFPPEVTRPIENALIRAKTSYLQESRSQPNAYQQPSGHMSQQPFNQHYQQPAHMPQQPKNQHYQQPAQRSQQPKNQHHQQPAHITQQSTKLQLWLSENVLHAKMAFNHQQIQLRSTHLQLKLWENAQLSLLSTNTNIPSDNAKTLSQ